MSRYPDWVNQFKTKGTSVKKVGDSYYLYSNTSKYVKGKKYPQPVQHFIGVITRDGVIESHKQKVSLSDVEVFEYGFSTALMTLCPQTWKDGLKNDWQDVLFAIIITHSPNSFIQRQAAFSENSIGHHNLKVQERRLETLINMKLKELYLLKNVYAVYIDGKTIISKLSEKQKQLFESLEITIGGEKG